MTIRFMPLYLTFQHFFYCCRWLFFAEIFSFLLAPPFLFLSFWRQSYECHHYFSVSCSVFPTYLSFQREKRRSRCCHSSPLLIGPVIEATGMRPASRDCCNEKVYWKWVWVLCGKNVPFIFLKCVYSYVIMCIYILLEQLN